MEQAAQLGTLAPLASPAFTGTPTLNGSPLGGGFTVADNGVGGISTSSSSVTDNGLGGVAA